MFQCGRTNAWNGGRKLIWEQNFADSLHTCGCCVLARNGNAKTSPATNTEHLSPLVFNARQRVQVGLLGVD